MKKIFSLISMLAIGALFASAQFMPLKKGTVLTFESKNFEDNKTEKFTTTVTDISKESNGLSTVELVEKHSSTDNPFGEIEENSSYTYTPWTDVTVHNLLTAQEYKRTTLIALRNMMAQGGMVVTDQDFAELEKAIKPKGDLKIFLPGKLDETCEFENCSIRCSLMGQQMGIKIVKGSYLGFEEIEVPAGKYNCLKLTYTLSIIGEGGDRKITSWYAKGVGIVKQTATDKKGKPLSEDVLVSISE